MNKVVIIGAGLTGLSAAYHFEQKQDHSFTIFEKEQTVGGLCRSIQQDGFTFDYTGHLLHATDPYFQSFLNNTIGDANLHNITRKSVIYSQNRYTAYPYQIHLHGLPAATIIACINGYINRKTSSDPKTFYQWALHNFGSGFTKQFFIPYQQKIFSYDPRKITASWTGRFVPKTSLLQILHGALHPETQQDIGYNSQFFYPTHGGINQWITAIARKLKTPIATNHSVQNIDLKTKTVIFSNGHTQQYDQLISTIPLSTLLAVIIDKPTTSFNLARNKLLCNSIINFNIGVNRPDLSEHHWIYFPENKYPFYRIGFPHNIAAHAVPTGCSSLYGEFSYINKSKQWIQTTLESALKATQQLLHFSKHDIVTEKTINIPHAYVIFNFWREQHLSRLLNALALESIHSIGRYGAWKYSSMQEAVLDGKEIVETLSAQSTQQSHPASCITVKGTRNATQNNNRLV
ncbi:MAG TPA: FAD-dependent oxidoreductase [Candidatus Babeliales bacterium]|nr:FAD-dependent oxidoreductase [Candidatus Babeliales bacterium]